MNVLDEVYSWEKRRYIVATVAGIGWLVISGVPTDIVDTPLFVRMTPVEWWNYPFWLASAVLAGLLAATYVAGPDRGGANRFQGKVLGGGLLSVFAIGCPICNKLVVLALGVSGTFAYFAPIQPILGFLSVGLLLYALRLRLSVERFCTVGKSLASAEKEVLMPAADADTEAIQDQESGYGGR